MELAGANPPPPPPKSKAPEVQNIVRHKGGAMTLAAVPKVGDSVPPSTTEDPLAPALVPQVVPNDTEADSASGASPQKTHQRHRPMTRPNQTSYSKERRSMVPLAAVVVMAVVVVAVI